MDEHEGHPEPPRFVIPTRPESPQAAPGRTSSGREESPPPPTKRGPQGVECYRIAAWLYARGLGVVFLVAFVSLWTQIDGLVGSGGILPGRERSYGQGRKPQTTCPSE